MISRYIKRLTVFLFGLLCLVSLNNFSFPAQAVPGMNEAGIYQETNLWSIPELYSSLYVTHVEIDSSGYIYLAGGFTDTVDFDFGVGTTERTSNGGMDAFVAKYTSGAELQWVQKVGGTGTDEAWELRLDASDNVYVGGEYSETVDFDPSGGPVEKTATGATDAYIMKYLSDGTFSWVRTWGHADNTEQIHSLVLDASGNSYAASNMGYGSTSMSIDYNDISGDDIFTTSDGEANVAVTKYSTSGAYVWTKLIRGSFDTFHSLSMAVDSSNLYISGSLYGTVDLDPGAGTASETGTGEHFLAKYNTDLTYGWNALFTGGDSWYETPSGLIAGGGNVYMTNGLVGTVEFDPNGAGDSISGNDVAYITSYTSAGVYNWTDILVASSGVSRGYQLKLDANSDLFIAGSFQGTVDFDPGAGTENRTAAVNEDIFVLKLNSDNTYSWIRTVPEGYAPLALSAYNNDIIVVDRTAAGSGTLDFNDDSSVTDEKSFLGPHIFNTRYYDATLVSITGLSADLDAIEFYDEIDAEIPTYELVDTEIEIVLKDHATGDPLAHVIVDLTESRDWSSVVGVHNGTTGKTFIDNLDTAPGVSDFQLYVQKTTGTNGVLVCPDATSLTDVTELCTNGYSLTASSGDAIIQDVGGVDYWRIYSLLGEDNVGGMPVTLTPPGPFIGSTTDGVYQWTVALGSTGYDYGFSTVEDLDGNTYATGLFSGTVDFDPGGGTTNKVSNGETDAYLAKYDADGNFLWVRTWGSTATDRGYSVDIDSDNNVLVSGDFRGVVDFDDSGGTANKTSVGVSAYLVKYSSAGNFSWVRAWGTAGSHSVEHAIDSSNNIYVATDCSGSVDFDDAGGTDTLSCTAGDLAITSYNTDGSYGDTFLMPSSDFAAVTDIERYGSYIYIGGRFSGTVDFDPSAGTEERTTVGGYDGFLAQYTTSGTLNWARQFGSTATDDVWGIAATDGIVYATGNFAGTLNFDPNGAGDYWYPGISSTAGFLTSYDDTGDYNWTKAFRGNSVVYPRAATADSNANIYVGGTFWGTPDFDSDDGVATPDIDYTGMFFLKYNNDGSFAWVRTTSGDVDGNASVDDIRFGSGNSTYVTGFFSSTFEFSDEPGISDVYTSAGSNDLFITKFDDLNKVNIESLAAPLDATDVATGRDAEVESAFIYGADRTVRLESASGSQPISDVTTDLTTTRNWSGVSASNDSVLGKAVVNNLSTAPGASATQTIYVPKLSGHSYVYICPNATTLSEVSTSCASGYILSDASPGVSVVNIGGADYWKVESVADVGGISVSSIPTPAAPPYYGDSGIVVPVIDFTIDDYIIEPGDTVTLTWSTTGLTELKLYLNDELFAVLELSGTLELTVNEETEAKLVGTGPNGSLERTFIIALIPEEDDDGEDEETRIRYFIVTADTTTWPVKVTIKWLVDNADSVDIAGVGDNLAPEGEAEVFITESTEFVLEAGIGGNTASETRKIIVPPRIEATMNTIISAIPMTIALTTALAVSAVTAAGSGGVATTTMINRIGVILGILTPKKKKTWGFVYDLSTYKPVPFVTIRLLQNGKLIDQTVSQLDGKYGIPVALAGAYVLELKALGFRPIMEEITVSTLNGTKEVVKDIALQRTDKGINVFNYLLAYLKPELISIIRAISTILFVVGMGISIWATIQTQSALNYALIGFYGIIILWNGIAYVRGLSLKTGSITDSKTGKGIKGAVVRIISPKDGQVGAYMTNSEGKIKFDLPAGRYGYTVARNGYRQVAGMDQIQIREDGYMSAPIRMEVAQSGSISSGELSNPFQA